MSIRRIDFDSLLEKISVLQGRNKLKLVIKVWMLLEGLVLLLFFLNVLFNGYTSIIIFHLQVWQILLSTKTFFTMLVFALPIALTAMGAAFNENTGVINIGLEGIMLWGAWAGVYFTFISGNPWIGILGAILFGLINSMIHAIFTITFKSEQIVTGVAINLFATGMTDVLTTLVWNPGRSEQVTGLPKWDFYDTPVLGTALSFIRLKSYNRTPLWIVLKFIPDPIDALSGHSSLFYISLILIPICHLFLFRTKWGLRMRIIGEHPQTAATAGIPVRKYQYIAVLISGTLAALGGALLSIGIISSFSVGIVGGRGFTALAAMIFGKWTILGSVLASIFFGYFYSLSIRVGIGGSVQSFAVPNQFLQMMPFIVSILALSGFIGRARAPEAIGRPYDPQED